jgi:hypothetical protein
MNSKDKKLNRDTGLRPVRIALANQNSLSSERFTHGPEARVTVEVQFQPHKILKEHA